MINKHKSYFVLLTVFVVFVYSQCRKKDDVVPYTRVNFTIYLNDPDFVSLQTVGNYVFVTGGVCGILIYHKSQDEFVAFDRCCPHNASERNAVIPDTTQAAVLVCPVCISKFSMVDGFPITGIAERPLTEYKTNYNPSNNSLQVYN